MAGTAHSRWIAAGDDARLLTLPEIRDVMARAADSAHWYRVSPTTGPSLLLRLERDEAGYVTCTAFAMGIDEIPGDTVGRVSATQARFPLQEIIADLVHAMPLLPGELKLPNGLSGGWVGRHPVERPLVRPGRTGFTPDDLRTLARQYREARKAHPEAPTKALAKLRGRSDQAIRYALKRAEAGGFLKRPTPKPLRKRGGRR